MAFSLLRALNPASKHSGIRYALAHGHPCQGKEMLDKTVSENVAAVFAPQAGYADYFFPLFNLIIGNHYDFTLDGDEDAKGGAKGMLDYLLFPLLARKIIGDYFQDGNNQNLYYCLMTLMVALPLETTRLSVGFTLTGLLLPIVVLINFIKDLICPPEEPEISFRLPLD